MKPCLTLRSGLRGIGACLPHELLFGILFATAIVGLGLARANHWAVLAFFVSLLFAQVVLIVFCQARPTLGRWRLRLIFYGLILSPVYPLLPSVSHALGRHLQDQALQHIETALVGFDLSVYLQRFNSPYLTELLSAAYLSYTIYFAVSQLLYLFDELELAIRFHIGLFTVFALGFLSYALIPANGPYMALSASFTVPLSGGLVAAFNQKIVHWGSNRIDVFPSLHCAVPVFILLFDFFHKRKRFWLCLLPVLLLLFSTVYLRYHYLVDLLAGLALALLALALSMRWPLEGKLEAARRQAEGDRS